MVEKVMAKLNQLKIVPESTDSFNCYLEFFMLKIYFLF